MKRLLFIVIIISLCSCSYEHKAKRFIKNLDTSCTFLFQDISKDCADVYYEKEKAFYKYDIKTKATSQIIQLNESSEVYLCDNFQFGNCDIFYYITDKREVLRYNLKNNESACINKDDEKTHTYVGGWNNHLLFYDTGEVTDCDKRIIDYDTSDLKTDFVKFNNIDDTYKKYFVPYVVIGNNGLIITLSPDNMDEGLDLYKYLYHYNFKNSQNGKLELLCQSDNIDIQKINDQTVVTAEKDIYTAVMYNLDGDIQKEFPTINGWPQKRGLTSGNILAISQETGILCYIANDDKALISSINMYYYDGRTGEEVELNSFKNPNGDVIKFVMGTYAREHIYTRSDNSGLVFYGETDFMNEYALFLFDFATRTTHVIDRGKSISFSRNRFKVEHHNGTVSWYNTNGEASQPERVSRDYFYDMGVEIGNMFNSLF